MDPCCCPQPERLWLPLSIPTERIVGPCGSLTPPPGPNAVRFSSNVELGLTGLRRFPSGKVLASFRAHTGEWGEIAFSPDEKLMATCSENGEAKLWDTITWQEKHLLRGHLLAVISVAFSPDGRRLATASSGKEAVKLWDVATGQEVATLEGQDRMFSRVMFSADGRAIAARTLFDSVVHLWRAPIWPEIGATERAGRAREPNK